MTYQSTAHLLMVRPTTFGYNEQTAETNAFQHRPDADASKLRDQALQEFDAFVNELRRNHIDVTVFEDPSSNPKPDAVFPNNWLSTWPDGTVYTYPMATQSRRVERSPAALDLLRSRFTIDHVTDLSPAETAGKILESTGVLVFDHPNRLAYACISPRCDEAMLREHCATIGYTPVAFHAYGPDGTPIYHTNVLMGVQTSTAVICSESITNNVECYDVLSRLQGSSHDVVDITFDQMARFAGNVLEVRNTEGDLFLVMSRSAYDAFTPEQREILGRDKTLLPVDIPTIETIGGGSARCMLAEIYLQPAADAATLATSAE